MKIESSDKKMDELLKGGTFFIPRFQREYSWEEDQITQFWSDIIDNMNDSYFIGSMVVYKHERSSHALVDGQQRLTTITILLCAIREHYKILEDFERANGLQAYIEQKTRDNNTVYVLETETSFPYLQEEVLKGEPSDIRCDVGKEEQAIQKAYSMFKNNISDYINKRLHDKSVSSEENRGKSLKWLSSLRDTVFDLNVIVITLDKEEDAYLIFETLNTRGKDLALSDLLRNHFTKYLSPRAGVDQAKIKWSQVLETISNAPIILDADTFIVHSWQSRYEFVTKAKLYPKIKSVIKKQNAQDHLDIFLKDAEHWRSIFDTEFKWEKNEKDISKSLNALRIFKVVQPAPGILSLIRAYRGGIIKYKHFREAISMIEKFHFSFNAVTSSRSSGGISGMYSSFGKQIFGSNNKEEIINIIRDLKSKLEEREPIDSEFDVGFSQIIYTKAISSQKSLVQYILKRISIHESQPYIGDSDDLTIEHLMPQSARNKGTKEDVFGQIGNLMLIDSETNNLLSDKNFSEKKSILIEKGYKLPQILLESEIIDESVIKRNTARVSEIARKYVWKI